MTDIKDIKAFVFDVDGVMTDGGIYAIDGDLLRRFEAKDCFAMRMASMHGYHLGVITGGVSDVITQRMIRCGFAAEDVYLGSRNKVEQLQDFCTRHCITFEDVLYCGDDVPDIGPMVVSGIGACPVDAVDEVKQQADIVSQFGGGKWFVRNIIELVMRAQGTWSLDVDVYKARF